MYTPFFFSPSPREQQWFSFSFACILNKKILSSFHQGTTRLKRKIFFDASIDSRPGIIQIERSHDLNPFNPNFIRMNISRYSRWKTMEGRVNGGSLRRARELFPRRNNSWRNNFSKRGNIALGWRGRRRLSATILVNEFYPAAAARVETFGSVNNGAANSTPPPLSIGFSVRFFLSDFFLFFSFFLFFFSLYSTAYYFCRPTDEIRFRRTVST